MTELLSCPFCGSPARLLSRELRGLDALVECSRCYGGGPLCETDEQAIAAWNRRELPEEVT